MGGGPGAGRGRAKWAACSGGAGKRRGVGPGDREGKGCSLPQPSSVLAVLAAPQPRLARGAGFLGNHRVFPETPAGEGPVKRLSFTGLPQGRGYRVWALPRPLSPPPRPTWVWRQRPNVAGPPLRTTRGGAAPDSRHWRRGGGRRSQLWPRPHPPPAPRAWQSAGAPRAESRCTHLSHRPATWPSRLPGWGREHPPN